MTILFVDEDGVTLSMNEEDGDLFITLSSEDKENTIVIDDVEKFIKAINFVTGKINS
jgi:hypothetical protein